MNRFTAIWVICLAAVIFGNAPGGANEVDQRQDAPFQVFRQISSGRVSLETPGGKTDESVERIRVLVQVADGWAKAAPRQAQAVIDDAWAMMRSWHHARESHPNRPKAARADISNKIATDNNPDLPPLVPLIAAQKKIDTKRASDMIDSVVNQAKDMTDPDLRSQLLWDLTDAWADLDRHRAEALADTIGLAGYRARAYMTIGRRLSSERNDLAEEYFTRAWECTADLEHDLKKVYLLSQLALAWFDLDELSGQLLFEETERLALHLPEPERSRGLKYIAYHWARRKPKQAFEMDLIIKWSSHGERGRYFLNQAFRAIDPKDETLFLNQALKAFQNLPAGPVREDNIGRVLCYLGSLDPQRTLALLEEDLIHVQRIRDDVLGSASLGLVARDPDLAIESAGKIRHPDVRAAIGCQLAPKLFDQNRAQGMALLEQAERWADPILATKYSPEYRHLELRNEYLLGCCFSAWNLYSPAKAASMLEKYSHIRLGTDRIVLMVRQWLDRGEIKNAEAAQEQALRFLTTLPPVPKASALKDLAQAWLPVDPDRAGNVFDLAYHTLVGSN